MYIWLAISAYLLLAVNGVIDKFLLSKDVRHPVAYAFYVGITGPLTFVLSALGIVGSFFGLNFLTNEFTFQTLSGANLVLALLGGACFPYALFFLYRAIKLTSISRVLPIQGGLVPIFTLILAYPILGDKLSLQHTWSFFFLVFGAMLISFKKLHGQWHASGFGNAIVAAFLFALSLVLQKYIFNHVNFASGLIWSRLGFFLASVSFLVPATSRKYIFSAPKQASTGSKFLYLTARISGGVAGLLQNYAIRIGSVTLVNAMQGTQYVFLLVMATVLSLKFPKVLKEHISGQTLFQKVTAVALVSAGLILLAT